MIQIANTADRAWGAVAELRGDVVLNPKRLSDFAFVKARTWPETQQAHRTWWVNYNTEKHYAHRERQDGRHSPCVGYLGHPFRKKALSERSTRPILLAGEKRHR